jgi:general secretion pathway protein J
MTRDPQSGVTLVEMLVALALFAVIGGAGLAVLDQVLRTQARTDAALAELAAMQRALHLVRLDAGSADPDRVRVPPDDPAGVTLVRDAAGGGRIAVSYALRDGAWRRRLAPDGGGDGGGGAGGGDGGGGAGGGDGGGQVLLPAVAAAQWAALDAAGTWRPVAAVTTPRALALTLTLADGGALRRVVVLPEPLP